MDARRERKVVTVLFADLVGSAARAKREVEPRRTEQLRRALAFFRRAGATRYMRRGEALLAASA